MPAPCRGSGGGSGQESEFCNTSHSTKLRKGELRFPLPVGFCYDERGRILLDLDEEVRGAVGLVFRLFRETGTAFAVMQRFAEGDLRFPKRAHGGAWDGKIIWGRLTHSRLLGILLGG